MIRLEANTSNTVVLTLNEKKISAGQPLYVFQFTNDWTKEEIIFYTPDLSVWPSRYNKFTVTTVDELAEINTQTGHIYLSPQGYWSYSIYEMPVTSPPSLDITQALSVVETGKMLLMEQACDIPVYESEITVPVYDPSCVDPEIVIEAEASCVSPPAIDISYAATNIPIDGLSSVVEFLIDGEWVQQGDPFTIINGSDVINIPSVDGDYTIRITTSTQVHSNQVELAVDCDDTPNILLEIEPDCDRGPEEVLDVTITCEDLVGGEIDMHIQIFLDGQWVIVTEEPLHLVDGVFQFFGGLVDGTWNIRLVEANNLFPIYSNEVQFVVDCGFVDNPASAQPSSAHYNCSDGTVSLVYNIFNVDDPSTMQVSFTTPDGNFETDILGVTSGFGLDASIAVPITVVTAGEWQVVLTIQGNDSDPLTFEVTPCDGTILLTSASYDCGTETLTVEYGVHGLTIAHMVDVEISSPWGNVYTDTFGPVGNGPGTYFYSDIPLPDGDNYVVKFSMPTVPTQSNGIEFDVSCDPIVLSIDSLSYDCATGMVSFDYTIVGLQAGANFICSYVFSLVPGSAPMGTLGNGSGTFTFFASGPDGNLSVNFATSINAIIYTSNTALYPVSCP